MSASSCGCSGASITQPRISPPASVNAPTSSTSSDASRSKIRWCRSLCAMNTRNASAVVANPPGTDTPSPDSSPIISPSDEFLPPTCARSARRRSCSHRMLAVVSDDSGAGWFKGALRSKEMAGMYLAEKGYFTAHHSPADKETALSTTRPVFYVSDGTGITAETIGHSLLTQFSGTRFQTNRIPFVDSVERAREVAERIRASGESQGVRPIVVNSSVNPDIAAEIARSGALILDVFEPFLVPLEAELGEQRQAKVGQAHGMVDFETYHRRINAMNFALAHDDGMSTNYDQAEVILVAVSRAGKTPTCIYLALHHGVSAANYPLTDE